MNPEYIIVQAGGKGTRLGHLTVNRPKALLPVDNLPMLFHLFQKYPEKKYIIIGDYKYDVLERYLDVFAETEYQMVCATGYTGTCAGLRQAVERLPKAVPFALIWSDLILPSDFEFPERQGNYIGVAKDFPCRWKFEDNIFTEECSDTFGVAGLFLFQNRSVLEEVPEEGELVRWLAGRDLSFQSFPLYGVKEYGLLEEYEKLEGVRCRPFNRIYTENGYFVKEAIDDQGILLAKREAAWYKLVQSRHFANIPDIVSYGPLKMERIAGKAIYEYEDLVYEQKRKLLGRIIECLKSVHRLGSVPVDRESYNLAYIGKTFQRLDKVKNLIPFARDEYVMINGRKCHNIFFCRKELENRISEFFPAQFRLIHGDCTFSNIMLREDGSPVLIDPRGYFGNTELYGDPAYDWAKLYYSVVGNYDQFNRRRFKLVIGEKSITLHISSNGWEKLESEFFHLLGNEVKPAQIHLLHAIIWLSLTTYAWEDYDSICGAFYNGLYYLEEVLDGELL